jgi:hypothetical protein
MVIKSTRMRLAGHVTLMGGMRNAYGILDEKLKGRERLGDFYMRESFEKFVDSHFYSDSELCEGAVTVSFSKYLPW